MERRDEKLIISRGCATLRSCMRIKNSELKKLREAEKRIVLFVLTSSINGRTVDETIEAMYIIVAEACDFIKGRTNETT